MMLMVLKTDSFSSLQRHNTVVLLEVKLERPAFDRYLDLCLRTWTSGVAGFMQACLKNKCLVCLFSFWTRRLTIFVCRRRGKLSRSPWRLRYPPSHLYPPSQAQLKRLRRLFSLQRGRPTPSSPAKTTSSSPRSQRWRSNRLGFSLVWVEIVISSLWFCFLNVNIAAEWHCPTTRPLTAREEKES